jgi:cell division septum initiation protein DivIVA
MDAAKTFEKMLTKKISVRRGIRDIEQAVHQHENAVEEISEFIAKLARKSHNTNDGRSTPQLAELMLRRANALRSLHRAKQLLAEARTMIGSEWQVV